MFTKRKVINNQSSNLSLATQDTIRAIDVDHFPQYEDNYDTVKHKLLRLIHNLSQNKDTLFSVQQLAQLSINVKILLKYLDKNQQLYNENKEVLINVYGAIIDPKNNAFIFQEYVNIKAEEYSNKANKCFWISVLAGIASVITFVVGAIFIVPSLGISLTGWLGSIGTLACGLYHHDKAKKLMRIDETLKNIENIVTHPNSGLISPK